MVEQARTDTRERIGDVAGRAQLAFALILLATGWFSIAISQIALGLAVASLLVGWIGGGRRPARTGLEWPAGLLAIWALGTIPFSYDPQLSLVYYKRFFLLTALWVTASCATDRRRGLALLAAAGLGAVGTSLFHQLQPLGTGQPLFDQRMEGFFNSMTTGLLLMLASLIALGVVVAARLPRRWRLVALLALASLVLGVVQSFTRSALLGLAAGTAAMFVLIRPRRFGPLLIVGLAAVVLFWGPLTGWLPDRLGRRLQPEVLTGSRSTQMRLEMWRGGWQMLKANPLAGVGDVGMTEVAPQYYGDETTKYFGHLHSNPVHMAAIWGVPGLVLGSWFLLAPGWILARRWRILAGARRGLNRASPVAGWVLGAFGAWVGFNLAGLTEWYFGDAESMLLYMALLGCALGTLHEAAQPDTAAAIEENDGAEE